MEKELLYAITGTGFTCAATIIGAALVFFFKKDINKNIHRIFLGFAAGVMIAATFFSLLSPAIAMANNLGMTSWIVVSLGFFGGGLLLFLGDIIFDYIVKRKKATPSNAKRIVMLISSITLHNIPEGLDLWVAICIKT